MDIEKIKEKLTKEGYTNVFVWEDAPNTHHPFHHHHQDTTHIILEGSLSIEIEGIKSVLYTKGDRFDVEAGESHYAVAGPEGCTYIIGQRSE